MDKILPSLGELRQAFTPDLPLLENVVRISVVYLSLYFVLRFAFRRQTAPVGMTNMLVLVLLADAVQNGMSGEYNSITNALVLGLTLLGWSYLLDWADFHVPALQSLLKPGPMLLIKNGKVDRAAMRRELLTHSEIMAQLRMQGVRRIEDVREAYVETSGEITVLPKEQAGSGEQKQSDLKSVSGG